MGEVFLATGENEQRVAIKVIDPRTTRVLKGVSVCEDQDFDKHIIKYREVRSGPRKTYYLVTDYLEVKPASFELLRRITHEELVGTFVTVARSLAGLHSKGVVHGNLKATNVLMRRERGKDKRIRFFPIVSDVGLSYIWDPDVFDAEVLRSIAPYMAPEVVERLPSETGEGEEPSFAATADVYSLGVLLCEAMTNRIPFVPDPEENGGITLDSIRQAKGKRRYRIIVKNDPSYGIDIKRLNETVWRCLEIQPDQRFQSMEALADELEACLDGGSDASD